MKRVVAVCSVFAVFGLTGCNVVMDGEHGDDEAEDAVALLETGLTSGTPITGISGRRGSEVHYSLAVPEGATNLKFEISGGSGDADLYVRFGSAPTRTTYDFRPYLDGNNELVEPNPVKAGTWYVMVRAYSTFSGLTLKASFDVPKSNPDPKPQPDPNTNPNPEPDPNPTGPDCHNPATWPAAWVAFEDEVLALVNQKRSTDQTCGDPTLETSKRPAVGPVVMDEDLREAARCHSMDMAVNAYFSHTSQDNRSPWDRIAQAGYTASPTGENIAAGYGTPTEVVIGWMTSVGHCNNIMNGNSNEMGVGLAQKDGSPYGKYWTQTFGHR